MPQWAELWGIRKSSSLYVCVCDSCFLHDCKIIKHWNLQYIHNAVLTRHLIGSIFKQTLHSLVMVWFAHLNSCCQQSRVQQWTNLQQLAKAQCSQISFVYMYSSWVVGVDYVHRKLSNTMSTCTIWACARLTCYHQWHKQCAQAN